MLVGDALISGLELLMDKFHYQLLHTEAMDTGTSGSGEQRSVKLLSHINRIHKVK
jgi:hypothetical protein